MLVLLCDSLIHEVQIPNYPLPGSQKVRLHILSCKFAIFCNIFAIFCNILQYYTKINKRYTYSQVFAKFHKILQFFKILYFISKINIWNFWPQWFRPGWTKVSHFVENLLWSINNKNFEKVQGISIGNKDTRRKSSMSMSVIFLQTYKDQDGPLARKSKEICWWKKN